MEHGGDDVRKTAEESIQEDNMETNHAPLRQSIAAEILPQAWSPPDIKVEEVKESGSLLINRSALSSDEPSRKRISGRPKKSFMSSEAELEMSCDEAEGNLNDVTTNKRSARRKKPMLQKTESGTESGEEAAAKKQRTSKKLLKPALPASTPTILEDIEKTADKYETNRPQRARRLASLQISKRMAEFAEQAKLIKRALEEEKDIEKRLVKLPDGIKPRLTQRASGENDVCEFSCGLCDNTANSMASLVEHFKVVHGVGTLLKLQERPSRAKTCGSGNGASRLTGGDRHDNESDNVQKQREELLTCGFCGKTERSTKALMIHFVLMHPASSTTIADDKKPAGMFFGSGDLVCGLCGVRKHKDTELMDHHRVAHPVFPPPFGGEQEQNAPTRSRRKQNLKIIKENAQMSFRVSGSQIGTM